MAKTSAIVTYQNTDGKVMQKTLTDLNPDTPNDVITTFAKMLNATSENGYISTTRIDKINCDTEESPVDTRSVPTFTIDKNSVSYSALREAVTGEYKFYNAATLTYNGDGQITFTLPFGKVTSLGVGLFSSEMPENQRQLRFGSLTADANNIPATIDEDIVITIGATETENFKAPEPVTFTITA